MTFLQFVLIYLEMISKGIEATLNIFERLWTKMAEWTASIQKSLNSFSNLSQKWWLSLFTGPYDNEIAPWACRVIDEIFSLAIII